MSRKRSKLIITCALTGSETTPSQQPNLPITPDEMAEEAYKAYKAGAAIAHIHVRNPQTGEPTGDLNIWREVLEKIKAKCPIICCPTTGGAPGMHPDERLSVIPEFKPEICSFTPESVSQDYTFLLDRYDFKWEWEREFIKESNKCVFTNNFEQMERFALTMKENGTKPECEFFSTSGIYNLRMLIRNGIIDLPFHCQFVLGATGGTGAYPPELLHFQTELTRLFGKENFTWSTIGVGYPKQFEMAALAIMMGGHVRVGFEDNIYLRHLKLAESNADLVNQVVEFADAFNREVATPDEARQILGLKGNDKVNF